MNNLLFFFLKARPWILFAIYTVIGCILLFSGNPYQQAVYLTSANSLSASVYNAATGVTSYFNLRSINESLQKRNADLELEVIALKQQLQGLKDIEFTNSHPVDSVLQRYDFIITHVINNSIHRPHNYITIEKGSLDGIKPDMGVVDHNGVVGKVDVVGPHYSRVISLLNNNLPISCMVRRTGTVGSLVWNGEDYREAFLEEVPRHATFAKGDTVVTSGYSTRFPKGIPIGVITEEVNGYDDNFHTLRVKLFTDFSKLSTVRVIVDNMAEELKALEIDTESDKTGN